MGTDTEGKSSTKSYSYPALLCMMHRAGRCTRCIMHRVIMQTLRGNGRFVNSFWLFCNIVGRGFLYREPFSLSLSLILRVLILRSYIYIRTYIHTYLLNTWSRLAAAAHFERDSRMYVRTIEGETVSWLVRSLIMKLYRVPENRRLGITTCRRRGSF